MAVDLSPIVGQRLLSVEKKDHSWLFRFSGDAWITTEGLWRWVDRGVAVSSEDHEQRFGRATPVDSGAELSALLTDRIVTSVTGDEETGDLRLSFSEGSRLEFLQTSAGYEGWQLSTGIVNVICVGGGKLVVLQER